MSDAAALPPANVEDFVMKKAYWYLDHEKDFHAPQGKNKKALKNMVAKFLSAPTRPLSEFPLEMFRNWYGDLPLAEVMDYNNKKGCSEVWEYHVILLYPQNLPMTKAEERNCEWARLLAATFYKSAFNVSDHDARLIEASLLVESTMMVVGRRCDNDRKTGKTAIHNKDSFVISAISFRHGSEDECGSALVIWLLVADAFATKPSVISSWRRLGFGRLMLIMLIKRSTISLLSQRKEATCEVNLPGVDVYLQCTQVDPLAFYHACGFVRINNEEDSGLDLLPASIQRSLLRPNDDTWIVPETTEHRVVPLMKLRSGCLLNNAMDSVRKNFPPETFRTPGGETNFPWCRYPPPQLCVSNTSWNALSSVDFDEAYVGLDLLNQLLPPLPFNPPLIPTLNMRLNGEMRAHSRRDHGRSEGMNWMGNQELEMMTALLMRDGRYDAYATILPFSAMQAISLAFGVFQKLIEATKFERLQMGSKRQELQELALTKFGKSDKQSVRDDRHQFLTKGLEDYIPTLQEEVEEKFGSSQKEIHQQYEKQMNFIIRSVLSLHPGILQKRILVFPVNIKAVHWAATFVFNPGYIGVKNPPLQTSFFRYCSKFPMGTRRIGISQGILWFLNLAYSCQEQGKSSNSISTCDQLMWFTPFGEEFFGLMLGTQSFPAMRLLEEGVLPKQKDSYSCGIGYIAAIAIVFCNFLGVHPETLECIDKYNDIFSPDTMVIGTSVEDDRPKEHVCCFPRGLLPLLPTERELVWGSYLHVLKQQWFILFDRIAHLQNHILPKRQDPKTPDNMLYLALKAELDHHKWPKQIVHSEDQEDDPTKQEEEEMRRKEEEEKQKRRKEEEEKRKRVEEEKQRKEQEEEENREAEEKAKAEAEGKAEDDESSEKDDDESSEKEDDESSEKDDDDDSEEDDDYEDMFPPPVRVWIDGSPDPKSKLYYPVDEKERDVRSRYETWLSEDGVEEFVERFRTDNEKPPERPPLLDESEMAVYVEQSFLKWGWSSNYEHQQELKKFRERKKIKMMQAGRNEVNRRFWEQHFSRLLLGMKKERRIYTRLFEREWKFGDPAFVCGLKYDPMKDTFTALLRYRTKTKEGTIEEKEERIVVSEEWIKGANYAPGIVQHVINLGNVNDAFVPVPPGKRILLQNKKVSRLRYVHPHTRWMLNAQAQPPGSKKGGKRMTQVTDPGYWEVIFRGETKPIRTDDTFVNNFKKAFLDEVKRLRCGFVDIPVGDFKVSHLQEHPNLQVHGAPRVHFVQSDGEDLCVAKSLASALYALDFTEEATRLNDYGETQLRGGTVDAIVKVGRYAQGLLPRWIQRTVLKKPEEFNWRLLNVKKETIFLGVLNESDGNSSHAVTIHGGFVYDANEVIAIPLCKESLDYCCSTATVKNEFVSFRKATLFHCDGIKDPEKRMKLTLQIGKQPPKRERDPNTGTETAGSSAKIMRSK